MTAFLKINGITIPVADGSASVELEEIGESPRSVNASQIISRRAVKYKWAGEIVLDSAANALAYKDLILGQKSQVWALDSHLYSYKGLPVTAAGSLGANPSAVLWTNSLVLSWATATTVVATDGYNYSTQPWSVSFWVYTGSVWQHVVETSSNQKYVNGTNVGTRTYATPSSTALTLSNASGTTWRLDDLWICQWLWPTTWPALVYAYATPTGPASRINCAGLMIEANGKTVVCRGVVESMPLVQAYSAGSWTPNMHRVRFVLIEV